MLTVVCVKVGERYGAEYVQKLWESVDACLSCDRQYVCITDDPTGIPLSKIHYADPVVEELPGWWQKLALFRNEDQLRIATRILYLDLDVVITGPLNDLVNYPTDFAMHLDFQKPWKCASAVMVLDAGSRSWIWDHFWANRKIIMEQFHGDQAYLEHLQQSACVYRPNVKPKPHCDFFPQRWVRSYKMHAQEGPPEDCRVVCFHGQPKMSDIKSGWVPTAW